MRQQIQLVLAGIINAVLWFAYGIFSTRLEWEGYNSCLFVPIVLAGFWLLWQLVPEHERPGN